MNKLRKSANGEYCQVHLPGCLYGGETVVLAHLRRSWNAGAGKKPPDLHATFACAHCHDIIDGRKRDPHLMRHEIDLAAFDGHLRTLDRWREMGLI